MVRLDEDIKGRERILIVDDDESTCETVSLVFNRSGFLTETARTGHEAIEKARSESFNVALLDARLPDVEGLELLGPLKQTNPDMATIVVTGYASVENVVKAFNDGAWAYLTKPLNMDDMLKTVREALCRQDEASRRREMYEEAQQELVEYRLAEEELRRCSRELETMLAQRRVGIQDARQYAESIAVAVREPLLILDSALMVVAANQAFYDAFGVTPGETEGQLLCQLDGGQWDIPELRDALQDVLPSNATLEDFEIQREFARIGRRTLLLSARRERQASETQMVLLTIQDVTERKRVEEALKEYEELSRSILESATVGVYITQEGKFQYVNPQYMEITGHSRDELLETYALDYVHPEDRELVRREATKQLKGESATPYEFRFMRKDGSTLWILERVSSIHHKGKRATLGIFMDVTERKRAEEALRDSERRYRLLAENATDVIWTADMDLHFTYVSPSVSNLLGYASEEAVSHSLDHLLTPHSAALASKSIAKGLARQGRRRQATSLTMELEHRCKNGSTVWLEVNTSILRDAEGNPTGLMGVSRDITERKHAEQKVEAFQHRLRSLASQLSLAEERERKRLATGLHDLVGQPLAAVTMKLGAIQERLHSTELEGEMEEAQRLVETAIQETRSLTFDLSPPILYELGLEAALEWLLEQIQNAHGIVCGFEDDGQPKPLGDDARGLLFWIVRELLVNVVKHARSHAAVVSIHRVDDVVQVTVEDDGIGFDTSELERRTRGFGLFSIRERLTEFGGCVEIESAPGQGTRVTLVAPLDSQNSEGGS